MVYSTRLRIVGNDFQRVFSLLKKKSSPNQIKSMTPTTAGETEAPTAQVTWNGSSTKHWTLCVQSLVCKMNE